MPTMLTAHFSLEEMVATQHRGIDNTPTPQVVANLRRLCANELELVRGLLGPLHVNSGYRSPALNVAVGGQPSSQHCLGLAADFVPLQWSLKEATNRILGSGVLFDQLIYEFGSWLHISAPDLGRAPRHQALMIGDWTGKKYLPIDLNKLP